MQKVHTSNNIIGLYNNSSLLNIYNNNNALDNLYIYNNILRAFIISHCFKIASQSDKILIIYLFTSYCNVIRLNSIKHYRVIIISIKRTIKIKLYNNKKEKKLNMT